MVASAGGHTETVSVLLEYGATIDLPDHVRMRIHSCNYVQSGMRSHTRLL